MNIFEMSLDEKKDLRDRLNAEIEAEEPWKPKMGEEYWVAYPAHVNWTIRYPWRNHCADHLWFERGLVFRTQEEAVAKAKGMVEK